MKLIRNTLIALCGTALVACSDLDLNPRDEAATGNWFQTPEQFEMNLNVLLLHMFWPQERLEWTGSNQCALDALTDDFTNRDKLLSFTNGSLNSTNPVVTAMWDNTYTAINRCNRIITALRDVEGTLDPVFRDRILGNARFYRACFYARLLMHFGDAVVVDEDIDIDSEQGREAAYLLERSDRWQVLDEVLREFDEAAALLPREYGSSEVQRATKGAAYGMKARTALHFSSIRKWDNYGLADPAEAERLFDIAARAAKACMDLGVYRLHPDFAGLFLQSTKNSAEGVFVIPRSKAYSNGSLRQYLNGQSVTGKLTRTPVGTNALGELPSWDLFCSFLCTDGLPIDRSPLYDPADPFRNRDPRCAATIVEFGTQHLGYEFNPRLDVAEIYSSKEDKMVTNNDSRTYLISGSSNQYASYNGLALKKGIDQSWLAPYETEPDKQILRYADVLLMYAEAKTELGEIDDSVLDAINGVRARAYGVDKSATDRYPAVAEREQSALRTVIRTERRMEFAFEQLRYLDLYRWRIAETTMNYPNYGLPGKDKVRHEAYMRYWFHGAVPAIDENGCPDFGRIAKGEPTFFESYANKLSQRKFIAPKMYLWPVPSKTMEVMPNIENNPEY